MGEEELKLLSESDLEKMLTSKEGEQQGEEGEGKDDNKDGEEGKDDDKDSDSTGGEEGKDDNKDGEEGKEGTSKKEAPKSIQKLLSQRNESRAKNVEYERLLAEKDKLIADLKNNKDPNLSDSERAEALTDAKIDKKLLEERFQNDKSLEAFQRKVDINSFVESHKEIGQYKSDFIEACENHPELTPRQVFAILKDEMGIGQTETKAGYSVAGQSKTKVGTPFDYGNMSEQQLEAELSKQHSSGKLRL